MQTAACMLQLMALLHFVFLSITDVCHILWLEKPNSDTTVLGEKQALTYTELQGEGCPLSL